MSFIDVLIPMAAAMVMISRPTAVLGKSTPPDQVAAKTATVRTCGYLLLAVAAMYAVVMLMQR